MPLVPSALQASLYQSMRQAMLAVTQYGIRQDNFKKIEADAEGVEQSVPDVDTYQAAMDEAANRASQIANNLSTQMAQQITEWITSGALVTVIVPPGVIATVGSPSAQAGPVAPVPITGTVA